MWAIIPFTLKLISAKTVEDFIVLINDRNLLLGLEMMVVIRSWIPVGRDPIGVVFLTHGVNEHIGRYNSLASRLTREGYVVYGHDHLGHGASGGTKGDIVSFQYVVEDLKQVIKAQMSSFPDMPCFLLGKSWHQRMH